MDGRTMAVPEDLPMIKFAICPDLRPIMRHGIVANEPVPTLTAYYHRGISKWDGTVIYSYGGQS